MQSLLSVARILGVILMVFTGAMQLPLLVSWIAGDAALPAYAWGSAGTFAAGLVMWWTTRNARTDLMPRDGMLLVSLVWTIIPAFACLPLLPCLGLRLGVALFLFLALSLGARGIDFFHAHARKLGV